MKSFLFFLLLSCISATVNAQARTGSVEYQKVARAALINEIPFPSKTIENALIQDFGKAGYKSSTSKGFIVFKGVRLTALGPDAYDLYFSSERVSRKEKDNSTVTLLISKGFDAFADESNDAQLFENGKTYMTNLRDVIAAYDLEQQIIAQENEVKKADKKSANLISDASDLQHKLKKIESEIQTNIKDQADQVKELDRQKQILENLKLQRKS